MKTQPRHEEPRQAGTPKTTAAGLVLYPLSYRGRTVWVSIPD